MDVDEPAVERNLAARDTGRDRRMGPQMGELDDDILEAGGANLLGLFERAIAGAHDAFSRVAVAHDIWAELATRLPEAGGQYAYLRDAYHPVVAFVYGRVLLLVTLAITLLILWSAKKWVFYDNR